MERLKKQTEWRYKFVEQFGEFKPEFGAKYISKYDEKENKVETIIYSYEVRFGELQKIPKSKTIYEYEYY